MARHTGIQWTDATLNVFRARATATGKTGWHCEHMSEACRFCYAEAFNRKLGTGFDYKPGHLDNGDVEIYLDIKALLQALTWRSTLGRPLRIFLHSMTDTFGRFVTDTMLELLFAVLRMSPHTIQILTKRPERLHAFMTAERMAYIAHDADRILREHGVELPKRGRSGWVYARPADAFPLPHFWLGTTVEDQDAAEMRLRWLMMTPAALRFVSYEPALGLVDWTRVDATGHGLEFFNALSGVRTLHVPHHDGPPIVEQLGKVDLIIGGGESGTNARKTPRALFLATLRQCESAGTTYYHKQNGDWVDADEWVAARRARAEVVETPEGGPLGDAPLGFANAAIVAGRRPYEHQSDGSTLIRVGVDAAGHLLCGKEYRSLPA